MMMNHRFFFFRYVLYPHFVKYYLVCIVKFPDIKKQRDEAIKKLCEVSSGSSVCTKCKNGVEGTVEEIVLSSQMSSDNQTTVILNTKVDNLGPKELLPLDTQDSKTEGPKARRKAGKKYRSLSKRSPRKKKELKDLGSADEDEDNGILVPDTVSLDENKFHVNLTLRRAHATQTVTVPETVPFDLNEDADFFETEMSSVKDDGHQDQAECQDFRSPEKAIANLSDTEMQESPVLGKKTHNTPKSCRKKETTSALKNLDFPSPHKETHELIDIPVGKSSVQEANVSPKVCKKALIIEMPDILDFKTPPKEPHKNLGAESPIEEKAPERPSTLQIYTEDLEAGIIVPQDTSTPRYSPLKFTRKLSPPLSDVSFASPSLLPPIKDGNMKGSGSSAVSPKARSKPEVKTRSLRKTMSAMSAVSSKENVRTLRRHQTDDKSSRRRAYEINIESADATSKKKYKQARIFDMPLVPKTDVVKLTGMVLFLFLLSIY